MCFYYNHYMKTPVAPIWEELKKQMTLEELDFLSKCFQSYSSKAHVDNVVRDLDLVQRITPPPQRVLDFGCGIGLQSYLLAKRGYQVIGLETVEDKSLDDFLKGKADSHIESRENSMQNVWEVIREKTTVSFTFYDGIDIPYNNEYFDVIFTYAVLEHIPLNEIPHILDELCRILKSDGVFYVFQLPQRTSYTEFIARCLGLESHPFLWEMETIKKMLTTRDFKILCTQKVDMLFNHPHKVINPLYSILWPLNRFLSVSPLSYFAHHLTIIAQKNRNRNCFDGQ
jgi:SAM-dependent methyltransferase